MPAVGAECCNFVVGLLFDSVPCLVSTACSVASKWSFENPVSEQPGRGYVIGLLAA